MVLAGLCIVLLGVAADTTPGQDWVPFQVASTLARLGAWHDVYPLEQARTLFDVSTRFASTALSLRLDVPANGITGFVSPPPAAFLLTPLGGLSAAWSNALWRLAIALPVCVAMTAFGEWRRRIAGVSPWGWTGVCLTAGILLFYIVGAGQPSGWLFVAAVCSVLPSSKRSDTAGGIALALACMTKATPLLVVVGLWLAGRRRFATIAAITLVVWTTAAWPWTGLGSWRVFVQSATHLGRNILADWNNASVDALLQRIVSRRTTSYFQQPVMAVTVAAWLARLALVGVAGTRLMRARTAGARVGAVWVAWLAATPLLWTHYLSVLMPLLPGTSRSPWRPLVPLVPISLSTWLGFANQHTALVATLSCAGWLLAAFAILGADDESGRVGEVGERVQ